VETCTKREIKLVETDEDISYGKKVWHSSFLMKLMFLII